MNHHDKDDGVPKADSISSDVCTGCGGITFHLFDKSGNVMARAIMPRENFVNLIRDTCKAAVETGKPLPFNMSN